MSQFVDAMRQKDTTTLNGAVTNSTSLNAVLDLFFIAGASRSRTEDDIQAFITKAFAEDPEKTLKVCFWAGDVRGGAGERRFFRTFLKWLNENEPATFKSLAMMVPYYNRWDSLFEFGSNPSVLELVSSELDKGNRLLAKWMPREGKAKYQSFLKAFRQYTGLTSKQYRKTITKNTSVVEQLMSDKKFGDIAYDKVPSVAFARYMKAFMRNDEDRFRAFLEAVEKNEKKINAGAIFPHDIYKALHTGSDQKAVNAQWSQLPNYLEGSDEKILPVCDTSGSMWGDPISISVSLGIYFSERNKSVFKDAFMTFSADPQMQYLKGTFAQRVKQLERAHWGMNTDLAKTFDVILGKALSAGIAQSDMPTTLLIISDMEFDHCAEGETNFEYIRKQYEDAGYEMPKVVFWNVNSLSNNVPISFNEKGVALVSGASPVVVKSVLSGEVTPMKVLDRTINVSRYNPITY